jgi:uncharacterized RDD family membrane protein YckC
MSSMPDKDATGDQGRTQQTTRPDVPVQPGAPQPPPQQQPYPGQAGQPYAGQAYAGQPGQPGRPDAAMIVTKTETRVTGRRVVQYIIDYVLAGIIPGLAYWLFDRSTGSLHSFGWVIATVIALAAYFLYWVVLPYGHRGQTFGMRALRLRVLSKDGTRASMMQLFIRGILLIIDTLVFGLVGFITMLCSKYRQRIGDHAAGTVVVPARYGPQV